MSDNVWEWCRDCCELDANNEKMDTYKKGSLVDPYCKDGSYRVFRGGSWNDYARFCRSSDRNYHDPSYRLNFLGFRVALVPVE